MIHLSTTKESEYAVEFVDIRSVTPSPENDDVYGAIEHDEQMDALIESIASRGLEEPIIVSSDGYIVSGHRRYFACTWLEWSEIPVRRKPFSREDNSTDWPRILTEYNPQRIKGVRTLLKEAMLRDADNPSQLLLQREIESTQSTAIFTEVPGKKFVEPIGDRQQEFLEACVAVVESLKDYWPLQVRQVHYNLLNDPPLTQTVKRSSKPNDHWRYRNNNDCYNRLVSLLVPARYYRYIPWEAIDDPTRPQFENAGFNSLSEFVSREVDGFLRGYHRDRQFAQPRHIEVLGEKNTLLQILKPVCQELYVPLTIGRGVCSHPVYRRIAERFKASGKARMSLLILSDYDSAGFDLADDAIRTLRDLWGVDLDYHRVGVTRAQIDDQGLQADFNPEKAIGGKLDRFIERTGGSESWELEALHPSYLQDQTRQAILANMDLEIDRITQEQEQQEVYELANIRHEIIV